MAGSIEVRVERLERQTSDVDEVELQRWREMLRYVAKHGRRLVPGMGEPA